MEKIITITAKTNKGKKALEQHWNESKKMDFKARAMFKILGYSQKIISPLPVTIELKTNNNQVANPKFLLLMLDVIEDSLKQNGAEGEKDYTIIIK
jgi:hypothetical protein